MSNNAPRTIMMKKPILATLGLAGACAACCAIPIILPALSAAALVGAAGYISAAAATGVGLVVAAVVLGLIAVRRSRAAKAGPACSTSATPGDGCGCAPSAVGDRT
jgi:hypothetical protein